MSLDEMDITEFSMRDIDEIWGQWNQSNEMLSDRNLPSSRRKRNQDTTAADITGVYDAEFKYFYEVPSQLVVHVPSARLNITRLVFCRNYRPFEADSCKMGNNCKFVHADVDVGMLEAFPIHVNYIWQNEKLCTYTRLPPGERLEVLSSDMCTVETFPSERILLTCGALAHQENAEPLIRCKYYDSRQTCYAAEGCNFVHVIYVDPNCQGSFKRAPKAATETRGATANSSLNATYHKANTNQNNNGEKNYNHNSNIICHVAENHGVPVNQLNWLPHVAVPHVFPSGIGQMPLHNPHNGAPFTPVSPISCQENGISTGVVGVTGIMTPVATNGHQQTPAPAPHCDQTEGNLQGLVQMLQAPGYSTSYGFIPASTQPLNGTTPPQQLSDGNNNATNNTTLTQEQLTGFLSPVLSLITQRVSSPHTFSIAPSPLLEEPYAMGTLLFLPRGASEAAPVQSVYDSSFLSVIKTLGSQQQRAVQAVMQANAPSVSQPNSATGGGTLQKVPYTFVPSGSCNMVSTVALSSAGSGCLGGGRTVGSSISSGGPTVDICPKALPQFDGATNGVYAWMHGV
ncbi:zinc finger protein family memeber [Trypanosoma rangeli]|uniref:Zinc finger protein family memeber n=1 Tax=Trypanosoma rangeli TaxID=5698 RepID=A0A3R7MWS6_TRYRA|nr:zinc finger protein family memeber [Trypanosoma rangeli]RNE96527.1 zinc finger protein family memeber [Trypanosoma rangeli]|eukprot:RNE96527.1 zinc finger protein family memeber [Trypanosoma rangeli]